MDPKKREIKELLLNELELMEYPMDKECRIKSWTDLLKKLILLRKIQRYHINYNGTEVKFDINNFTYYLNFESTQKIQMILREKSIDRLINP